jgi:hypothetical protein
MNDFRRKKQNVHRGDIGCSNLEKRLLEQNIFTLKKHKNMFFLFRSAQNSSDRNFINADHYQRTFNTLSGN